MNLKQLAVFRAVADTGSISGGAKQMYLSQSVVSRHIRTLEDRLGLSLFDRLPRGVELTEAGETLADYAHQLFALEAEAETIIDELRGLRQGQLLVGASMTIGNYLMPLILTRLHQRHPAVRLLLSIGNSELTEQRLLQRDIDIGLTEGLTEHAELESTVFLYDQLIVVVSPRHPLAQAKALPVSELSRYPCVMREQGSGTRAVVEKALSEQSLTINEAMALGSTEAVKHAVMAGYEITIISSHAVASELASGQLVHVPVTGLTISRPLHLLQRRHKSPNPAATAFLKLIDEVFCGASRRRTS
jgi:DNA-binding transcriptional LysR family regulator